MAAANVEANGDMKVEYPEIPHELVRARTRMAAWRCSWVREPRSLLRRVYRTNREQGLGIRAKH